MNRRCDRCEFWQVGPLKRNGDCRRNPPPWRQTGEEDWCGEFELREDLEALELRRRAGEEIDARYRVAEALNKHRKDWPTL